MSWHIWLAAVPVPVQVIGTDQLKPRDRPVPEVIHFTSHIIPEIEILSRLFNPFLFLFILFLVLFDTDYRYWLPIGKQKCDWLSKFVYKE